MLYERPTNSASFNRTGRGFDVRDAALLAILFAATIIVLGKDITVGGLRYGDAPAHAMDGVLIHDWLRAGPSAWVQPIRFAEEQYAHYPTLGIGRHYPPGFAAVEALFFAAFGISAATSRMTVVFFALFAVAGVYAFVRQITRGDRTAAALSGVALLTLPATVEWGRDTMLEVPLMAGLAWSAAAFAWYVQHPTLRRLGITNVAIFGSLLFKQTALFAFPAAMAAVLFGVYLRRFPRRHGLVQVVVTLLAAVAVYITLDGHGSSLLRGDATYADRWSWVVWTGYLQIVPEQVGWSALGLAVIGFAVVARRNLIAAVFLAGWFAACWAMLTFADFKYNRYLYPGLLPFAVCAGIALSTMISRMHAPRVQGTLASAVSLVACAVAAVEPVRIRPDYGALVAANRSRIEGQMVLFSGLREGDFVFAVRQHIPWRSAVVIRGSKVLYTCNGRPDLDLVSLIDTPEKVPAVLGGFAFEHIFVEREDRTGVAQEKWLRSYLANGADYILDAEQILTQPGAPSCRELVVDVYRATQERTASRDVFEIPIPRAGKSVRVKLTH